MVLTGSVSLAGCPPNRGRLKVLGGAHALKVTKEGDRWDGQERRRSLSRARCDIRRGDGLSHAPMSQPPFVCSAGPRTSLDSSGESHTGRSPRRRAPIASGARSDIRRGDGLSQAPMSQAPRGPKAACGARSEAQCEVTPASCGSPPDLFRIGRGMRPTRPAAVPARARLRHPLCGFLRANRLSNRAR